MTKNRRVVLVIGTFVAAVIVAGGAFAATARDSDPLSDLKSATKRYQDTADAERAGWVRVEGLDHCFDNPGVGAMGFHYINTAELDTELDDLKPEALVYEPLADGRLKLAAVEWIVPVDPWRAAGHSMPPQVGGHHMHENETLGVYVLHAWIFKKNPAGTFEDWNPAVSCPAE